VRVVAGGAQQLAVGRRIAHRISPRHRLSFDRAALFTSPGPRL
jgi:hypothetical protein